MKDFLIVYGAIALLLTMAAAGAWLGHSLVEEVRRRRGTSSPERSAPEERYGHPRPPLSAVRASLPPPPVGHMWELSIQPDRSDHPNLHLALISITGGKVDEMSKSLIWGSPVHGYWTDYYVKYPSIEMDTFKKEFVGKFIGWARRIVLARSAPTDGDAYWAGS